MASLMAAMGLIACAMGMLGGLSLMRRPQIGAPLVLLLIGHLWVLSSSAALSFGFYTFELGRTTGASLAPLSLLAYDSVFFAAAGWVIWMDTRRQRIEDDRAPRGHSVIWILGLVVLGMAIGYVLVRTWTAGPALFSGQTRQAFQLRVFGGDPIGARVTGSVGTIGLLLGTAAGSQWNSDYVGRLVRRFSGLLFLLLGVQLALAGHRFSGFLLLGYSFLMPIVVLRAGQLTGFTNWARRVFRRRAARAALLAGIGVVLTFGAIRIQADYSRSNTTTLLSRVFVLQGELWWAVHEARMTSLEVDWVQLSAESRAVFPWLGGGENEPTGLRLLMERYGAAAVVFSQVLSGFTGGYPAIGLEVMGPVLMLPFQLAMGLALGLIVILAIRAIRQRSFVLVYLTGSVLSLANSAFAMGSLADLFRSETYLKIAMVLVWFLAAAVVRHDREFRGDTPIAAMLSAE